MKLIKFLTTISLLFVFTFSVLPNELDECKDLLNLTGQALRETTIDLKEAKETIKDLREKNSSLEKQISEDDSALLEKNQELEDKLEKANEALAESNETLEKARQRIIDDGKEIERLRSQLKTCINNLPEVKLFTAGLGLVYPYGPQFLFMFNIPKISISVFTDVSIIIDPFGFYFTIGAAYSF